MRSVRRLVLDFPAFGREFDITQLQLDELREVETQQDRGHIALRRRTAVAASSGTALLALIPVILVMWQDDDVLFSSGILITVLFAALGVIIRGLLPLVTRRQ